MSLFYKWKIFKHLKEQKHIKNYKLNKGILRTIVNNIRTFSFELRNIKKN